jgi:hypothetical protein
VSDALAPLRTPGFAWQVIDGETVLLDVGGHNLMGLNATGARVWQLADGQHSIAAIVDTVAAEFGAPTSQVLEDVRGFVDGLAVAGALSLVPASDSGTGGATR